MKGSSTIPAVYEKLRRHLDRQPVGFPATRSKAELKVLRHIFSPDEALAATCLSSRFEPVETIVERAGDRINSCERLVELLETAVAKGGIEKRENGTKSEYRNAPLVVGMYEYQLGRLNGDFIRDFAEYTSSIQYGLSFLSTHLPQMRTIPIEKSITADTTPANFDSISTIIRASDGPFAVCECICRKKQAMLGHTCKVTQRKETCLAVGHLAQTAVQINMGKGISKQETLAILEKNQEEGLVLQPTNSREVDFICSCCGCCCGMLRIHQKLPRPLNFWECNYVAKIDPDACNACGRCYRKCQVGAVAESRHAGVFAIDPKICIGCGVCVAVCRERAVRLLKRDRQNTPPKTREELFEIIGARKKGQLSKLLLTGNLVKDALLTGRTRLLKSK